MQAPLRAYFRDLPTVDMKEIRKQRMFEDDSYKANNGHKDLYEALQKSLELDYSNQRIADQEEARKKRRKRCDAPRSPPGSPPSQPPPPTPPAGASGALGTLGASGSSQFPPPPPPLSTGTSGSTSQQGHEAPSSSKTIASAQQSMAWTTSDTRYESTGIVQVSDDQDSENDHTPAAADLRKDWWKPLPEEERPATSKPLDLSSSTIVKVSTGCHFTSVPNGGAVHDVKIVLEWANSEGISQNQCQRPLPFVVLRLTRILETLDYKVKEFKIKWLNPGDDEGQEDLQELECFVGGRVHDRYSGFLNLLVHSLRALSTLRRSGLRMAKAAAKPCQGDSLESYLITGSIYTE
ncbi:hypothetical protein Tco_0442832 [Tanacetum coccineum]